MNNYVADFQNVLVSIQSVYAVLLRYIKANFQNVNCFVFQQSIVFHKGAVQNINNVVSFKTSSMCIFNLIKKQSGSGVIVVALFGNFAYLRNLYTVVELHTIFV